MFRSDRCTWQNKEIAIQSGWFGDILPPYPYEQYYPKPAFPYMIRRNLGQ